MPRSRASAILRTIGVVSLLGLGGGLLGGFLVAGLIAGIAAINGARDFTAEALGYLALVATGAGALYGVVLGPVLSWTLMRRVPLGRAIGETALLAAIGVEISMVVAAGSLVGILGLPVLFAALGALRLRHVYREKATTLPPGRGAHEAEGQ